MINGLYRMDPSQYSVEMSLVLEAYKSINLSLFLLLLCGTRMALTFCHFSRLKPLSNVVKISYCSRIHETEANTIKQVQTKKRCLRCKTLYLDKDNSPAACSFHGHITGEKGLYSLAPPHQGIDGEWSDRSGVIVYKWNEKDNRPNTGRANWKKRWSCCSEYDENASPCRLGWHVSYDDGFTLY